VRRPTLITIIVLFALLLAAAIYQGMIANGPRRYPGPGFSPTPTVSVAPPSAATP
jgi:hypothetical protein